MINKKENYTFRTLYLMAIVFVIDGHIPLEGELFNFGGLFRYYSFHMMLFMFCSGYFFKEHGFLEGTIRDIKKIIIPLYIWNCFYGILSVGLSSILGMKTSQGLSLYTLTLAPILDGQQFAINNAAWFLFPLFAVKMIYRTVDRLFKKNRYREMIFLCISLLIGCFCVNLCRNGGQEIFPLVLLRIAILLPGYVMGVLYRNRLEKWDVIPTELYLIIIILLRLILCTVTENLAYIVSDCTYFATGGFGVYFGGILAIAFYLRIARLLNPLIQKSRILLYLSRNTFSIMMHHKIGFLCLNIIFLFLNWMRIGAVDFSLDAFRTVESYVYAPQGKAEWAILYVIVGLMVPWIISKISDRITHNREFLQNR